LREVDEGDGVDVGCCEEGLVTVAVVAAVGIGGAGLIADAAGGAVVVVDTRWVVLGIEAVPARIVHKLAVVIGAEVAGLARVVVAVAIAAAAVVDDANVVAHWLAFDTVGVVVVAGDSRWLWLLDRARIAISYACDVGLFLRLAAIRFSFSGFGDFGLQWRCGGD